MSSSSFVSAWELVLLLQSALLLLGGHKLDLLLLLLLLIVGARVLLVEQDLGSHLLRLSALSCSFLSFSSAAVENNMTGTLLIGAANDLA